MKNKIEFKKVANNQEELMALFDAFQYYDTVEEFLGIEFAFVDGSYQDNTTDELQDVGRTAFRLTPHACLPTAYPCVVILYYEKTFDRMGDSEIRMLDYVYLSDFITTLTTEDNQ